jgi:hypothetical protein
MPPKSWAEQRSTAQFGPLLVDYVVTLDEFDGRPVPPGFMADDFWALVAPLPGGRTRWRRIRLLQKATAREAAP